MAINRPMRLQTLKNLNLRYLKSGTRANKSSVVHSQIKKSYNRGKEMCKKIDNFY